MLAKTSAILLTALIAAARPLDDAPLATVYSKCVVNKTVALTFDDGPYIYQRNLSDLLTQYNAKGTFFVNGNNYGCIYDKDVVQNLQHTYNAGHQICSHTWSHPDLKKLNADQIGTEIQRLDVALKAILGIRTPFLRPPYGNYNKLVRQVAPNYSKSLVIWDFDSGDSVGKSWNQSEALYNKTISKLPQNLLPLNHETEVNTTRFVVPWVIPRLQSAGYKLVTLAECLGLEPYLSVEPSGERDDTWKC
ncbi:carbohydrate esterase family 4 protein [Mycena capillaripes]|nr:carbohydrate esterase family 4 protein [Mycena capillaripes]